MGKSKSEKFIMKWIIILYLISLLIYSIIGENIVGFVMGLTLSTFLCLAKFLLNSYYFNIIISRKKTNVLMIITFNIIFFIMLFISIYIILKILGQINLSVVYGLILGISYIPLIIVAGGILQSLYLIRNKF